MMRLEKKIKKFLQKNYSSGSGNSSGSGYGNGSGNGSGNSSGSGYGDGSGNGSGLKSLNKENVYIIDKIETIIKSIKNNIAKGFIVKKDLTLEPCYIAKKGSYFAHGKTIKQAVRDVVLKELSKMDVVGKIAEFKKIFKDNKEYLGSEFFKWHGILTGSCEMGRESFCKNNDIDLDDLYTINEFIDLVKDQYGSEIIEKLKERENG